MGKSKLTKLDIVNKIFENDEVSELSISKQQVTVIVSKFIETLREEIEVLEKDERIELRGFGTFGIRERNARTARNPKTSENVQVPARKSAYFKAGRQLRSMSI